MMHRNEFETVGLRELSTARFYFIPQQRTNMSLMNCAHWYRIEYAYIYYTYIGVDVRS